MNQEPCILALDLGTSSVRAILYDRLGRPVPEAERQRPYSQTTTEDGGVETDPDTLVRLTVALLKDLTRSLSPDLKKRVRAVAASCFWHSLMGVDADGRAATPLYSWADTRAAGAALRLRSEIDPSEYHVRTGCELHPCFWPAKLLWLRETQPDLSRRVVRWMGFGDYLYLRLFGKAVTSISMASGTGLYDPNRCEWDEQALGLAGVKPSALPGVVDCDAPLSGLADEFRRALAPLAGLPWYPAVGDGACSNIGGGGLDQRTIAFNIGTSAAMRITVEAESTAIVPGLFCYRIDRKRLLTGGAFATGGNMYAWLEGTLKLDDVHKQVRASAAMQPAAHGLTVLPFWAGERSPGWHPQAQAAIFGMNLHTTSHDILRASLESAAFLYDIVRRRLAQRFPDASTIVATGGALAHDTVWTQILADVFGAPIETRKVFEASSRGAAILALENLGIIRSASQITVRKGRVFKPDAGRHEAYAGAAAKFEEMYERHVAGRAPHKEG